jgi:hypothetical protein
MLSCTSPLLPSEQLQFIGAWTLQGGKSIPRGCWPMLTPVLPTVVSSWLDVLWMGNILNTDGKVLSVKNPAALQFLTQTSAPGTYYHTPFKGT